MNKQQVKIIGVTFLIIIIGFSFMLTYFFPLDQPTGMHHKPDHAGGGGAGGGAGGGTTTPAESSSSSGDEEIPAVNVFFDYPKDGDTIKRGNLTLLVRGYEQKVFASQLVVTASSKLFGNTILKNNFEKRGRGIYGAKMPLGQNISAGKYEIIVKAQGASYDEERIIVTFDPRLYINASFNKQEYLKGEQIILSGRVHYFDKKLAKNNPIELSVSGDDFQFNKTIISDLNGYFEDHYLISFADPDKLWDFKFHVIDTFGNEGSTAITTTVGVPKNTDYYLITFLSPLYNGEFSRGTIIPITVEIKEENTPVANAFVEFRDPYGNMVPLKEIRPGVYSKDYKISANDPIGLWYISVQGLKTYRGVTKAGGSRIPIIIKPASMNLMLKSPTTSDFFTGQKVSFKTELTYTDGTPIKDAQVSIRLGNQSIILQEHELGVYTQSYVFTNQDVSADNMTIIAVDSYSNSHVLPLQTIHVEKLRGFELKLRLFYYNLLIRYWYFFVIGLLILVAITEPLWYRLYVRTALKRAIETEKRLFEMQKDTQRKYFKYHSLNKQEYDRLMLRYKEKTSDIKEKKLKLERKFNRHEELEDVK